MFTKIAVVLTVIVKVISSQRIVPLYPQSYTETFVERYTVPPSIPTPTTASETDILCKNLALTIQNMVLEKFSKNCNKPPFIPLLNEVKNSMCNCPVCSAVSVNPNGISNSYYVPSNVVSQIIQSSPCPRTVNISQTNKNDIATPNLAAVLNGLGCNCGCKSFGV